MKKFNEATLISTEKLSKSVKHMTFLIDEKVEFIPGQFFKFRIVGRQNELIERDYSILETDNNKMSFCIEKLKGGALSPLLHKMEVGEKIKIKGPLGSHFLIDENEYNCFISSGTGVVPFISFIRKYPNSKYQMLSSFKTKDDVLFLKEITSQKCTITLTREKNKTRTKHGRINGKMLKDVFGGIFKKSVKFYICGSSVFVLNTKELLIKAGVKDVNIITENFG